MIASANQFRATDGHPIFDAATKQRVNPSKDITTGNRVWFTGEGGAQKHCVGTLHLSFGVPPCKLDASTVTKSDEYWNPADEPVKFSVNPTGSNSTWEKSAANCGT